MTITLDQRTALAAPLKSENVKQRAQSGITLSYIEAWKVIEEANRIFGFDGWSCETLDVKCVAERERPVGRDKTPGHGVSYTARVRVAALGVVRDGVGAGHGIDRDLGQAHESALKEAESDARKRALMSFGYQFGLALYDKSQEHVTDGEAAARPTPSRLGASSSAEIAGIMIDEINACVNTSALDAYTKHERNRARYNSLSQTDQQRVIDAKDARHQKIAAFSE